MIHNKKSTYTNYRYIINKHINQYWSNYYVFEINDIIVMEYIEMLYKLDLKSKTIKDILTILKGIFKLAQIDMKIPTPHINHKLFQSNNGVEKYLSAVSGRTVTTVLPLPSFLASFLAAATFVPLLMPHIKPSIIAKSFEVWIASSSVIIHISS